MDKKGISEVKKSDDVRETISFSEYPKVQNKTQGLFGFRPFRNRKAISEVVGYVLLIIIAISLAVLVYAWLKGFMFKPQVECPENIAISLESYSCLNNKITLSLKNTGFFNIDGFLARVSNTTKGKAIYFLKSGRDIDNYFNNTNKTLAPNEVYSAVFNYSVYNIIKKLEIQPFIYDKEAVLCQAIISREINNCGAGISNGCVSNDDCQPGEICTNGTCNTAPVEIEENLTGSDITEDGFIEMGGGRYKGEGYILADEGIVGSPKGYIEFNTASIPDSATISSIILEINYLTSTDFSVGYFTKISIQPSVTTDNSLIYNDIAQESTYALWSSAGGSGRFQYNLGSSAADLQSKLSQNWFAVGINATFLRTDMLAPDNFLSSESANPPKLIVTYS